MSKGFGFFHKKNSSTKQIHVWSLDQKRTLCGFWSSLQEKDKLNWEVVQQIPYGPICKICDEKLTKLNNKKTKGPKIAPYRPEEEAALERWRGSTATSTLWERMDKDPAYDSAVRSREGKQGTAWGIGKPKAPN